MTKSYGCWGGRRAVPAELRRECLWRDGNRLNRLSGLKMVGPEGLEPPTKRL